MRVFGRDFYTSIACVGTAVALCFPAGTAHAADPVETPSGFYLGGHVGYGFGNETATLGDPIGVQSSGGTAPAGMLFGGVQGGYQKVLPSHWMLGVEADLSFANYQDLANVLSYRATNAGDVNEQLEYLGTLRGRVGYATNGWMPFLTGGLAFASVRESRTDLTTGNEAAYPGQWRLGYVFGGGIDRTLDRHWSARLEYLYTSLGLTGFSFSPTSRYDSQYDFHRFRIGLDYHFGAGAEKAEGDEDSDRGPGSFKVWGQSTFIFQGYPPFQAPYSGANSFDPGGQSRETWTSSLFFGARLWRGGEVYINPELLQGFGLADTTGAAGFPNGEAQKSNFPFPRFNLSRLFLRQEFGLGGATEKVESDYGQLAGTKDVKRVTLQIGKFSVKDLFDTNDYAQDSRVDFLNWSIWAAGAFDYPADRVGLTYGATAEYNDARWAVRAGYFLVGNESNSNIMDWNLFSRGGYLSELELRYDAWKHAGQLKIGPWLTSTFAGSYADAVALTAANPAIAINDALTYTRQTRVKYGIYANLQQEITSDLGAFARFSWNNGQSEISAFTDIDESFSGGIQLKGTGWGRPDDKIGLAGAYNIISPSQISFTSAGGLGVLIGDGQLSYAAENVIETYYALQLTKGFTATADYQLLVNPAYNSVRGPVNVFSGRLHLQF